ncbi:hypothetical protein GDO81_004986 [Engystomops pustulosus]|uniref:Uncharacterized protein n=1 Tax=Engystomops pustulosus TaxID=76066 RepID=A0AAV7CJV7_ENGPU|nr:hypothetical protein GDO81_004986 [Engystomops pustulosus]
MSPHYSLYTRSLVTSILGEGSSTLHNLGNEVQHPKKDVLERARSEQWSQQISNVYYILCINIRMFVNTNGVLLYNVLLCILLK